MFWAVYAAFSLVFSGVPFLHTVNFVTAFALAHTIQSCRTFKIHSLFVIVCTHLIHTATAFVIELLYGILKHKVSKIQNIYEFYRGHETSLV